MQPPPQPPPPHGYGPPQGYAAPYQQPYPVAPPHNPHCVTPTDIIVRIILSVFCGIGGFVGGLIKMAQGHNKPGWIACAINGGVWVLGIIGWIILLALAGAAASVAQPPPP